MFPCSRPGEGLLGTSKLNPEAAEFVPSALISLVNRNAVSSGTDSNVCCSSSDSKRDIAKLNGTSSILRSLTTRSTHEKCSSNSSSSSTCSPPSSSSSSCSPPSSYHSNVGETDDVAVDNGEVEDPVEPQEWCDSIQELPSQLLTVPLQGTTYADVTRGDLSSRDNYDDVAQSDKRLLPLCPFARGSDHCPQPDCTYLHGDKCDFCNCLCLHPFDREQRNIHRDDCIKEHEREMEQAFAIQRSSDKACGICMDIILDKELLVERRFGILEKCDHVFCLTCIRKWRQTEQLDKKTIRSCPECRVFSAFVIPSTYWYDSGEEKDKLIANYKKALSQKPCKYFKQGQGQCPFAGACFYLHAYPDGRKADMPPPTTRRRENNNSNSSSMRVSIKNYLSIFKAKKFTHRVKYAFRSLKGVIVSLLLDIIW